MGDSSFAPGSASTLGKTFPACSRIFREWYHVRPGPSTGLYGPSAGLYGPCGLYGPYGLYGPCAGPARVLRALRALRAVRALPVSTGPATLLQLLIVTTSTTTTTTTWKTRVVSRTYSACKRFRTPCKLFKSTCICLE